jgi:hypothetical protein
MGLRGSAALPGEIFLFFKPDLAGFTRIMSEAVGLLIDNDGNSTAHSSLAE